MNHQIPIDPRILFSPSDWEFTGDWSFFHPSALLPFTAHVSSVGPVGHSPIPPPASAGRLARQLRFALEIDKLKNVLRRTYVTGSGRPENSAEHTWHIVLMAVTLAEHSAFPHLDVLRVVKMLLIHDLVEIDAGDTFAYDTAGHADKRAREVTAAERLFGLLPPDQAAEFRALWEEFEATATPEARFALAMDRVQAVMLNLAADGGAWKEHGITLDRILARNAVVGDAVPAVWASIQQQVTAVMSAK
ncbi:MAG: HD domain-containing protein [Opitutae bacterium]|nr:HD domain-containing protein [Opitutae bacterium]